MDESGVQRCRAKNESPPMSSGGIESETIFASIQDSTSTTIRIAKYLDSRNTFQHAHLYPARAIQACAEIRPLQPASGGQEDGAFRVRALPYQFGV
jgi:hypothetical protein